MISDNQKSGSERDFDSEDNIFPEGGDLRDSGIPPANDESADSPYLSIIDGVTRAVGNAVSDWGVDDSKHLSNAGRGSIRCSDIASAAECENDPLVREVLVKSLMKDFPELSQGSAKLENDLNTLIRDINTAKAFRMEQSAIDEMLEKRRMLKKTVDLAKAIEKGAGLKKIESCVISLELEKVKTRLFQMRSEDQYTEAGYLLQIRREELELELAEYSGADMRELDQKREYLVRLRKVLALIRRVSGFDPTNFTRFVSKIPVGEFEESLNFYALELPVCREKLMEAGLKMAAEDIFNLDLEYSRVDGSSLKTLMERKIFFEKMSGLPALDLEYFRARPETKFPKFEIDPRTGIPSAELKDADQYYALKIFTGDFIYEKVLPDLIEKSVNLRDVFHEIHKWQMRGSLDQLLRIDELDICAGMRKELVCVSGYLAPPYDDISELMDAFAVQLKLFCDRLQNQKSSMKPDQYEDAVINLALYAQQRMVDIHPMPNGNGRLARSLYEYIVQLFLGKGHSFNRLPEGNHVNGEPTVSGEFMGYNVEMSRRDFLQRHSAVDNSRVLMGILSGSSLDLVLNDELITVYKNSLKKIRS